MTDKPSPNAPSTHSVSLLPWYINGTLSETEMDQVSHDAQTSALFAEQVHQEIQLAKQWRDESNELDELLAQEDFGYQQLTAKLTANSKPVSTFFNQYLAAAILLLGLVLAGLYATLPINSTVSDRYRTLSTVVPASTGVVLQVIFQPDTTEREMRILMLDGDAHVLSGPTPQGVYRLALPAHINGAHYAQRLKQHPAIRWAELEVQSP